VDFLRDRTMRVGVHGSFSEWWVAVLSGVPQGSVLGPLLFLISVNDLPDWVVNGISMFADDTKVWRGILVTEDQKSLQDDLNKLMSWSDKWLLKFNPEKCKAIHIGHGLQTEYEMTEDGKSHKLQSSQEERDLGIYIAENLKPGLQRAKAASKAISILGLIRRFGKNDKESFRLLYKTYVRPQMEYCVQAWSPYLVKDIECLQKVQQRATKMVRGLEHVSYNKRLKVLGLYSHAQTLAWDLIEESNIFPVVSDSQHTQRPQHETVLTRSQTACTKVFLQSPSGSTLE